MSTDQEIQRLRSEWVQLLFGQHQPKYPHRQAQRVVEEILPVVMRRYLFKAQDYDENAQTLGYAGQFADIHRKYSKLRRAWWDGKPLSSEPAEEVAADMIAHLLLGLLFSQDEEQQEALSYQDISNEEEQLKGPE